MSDRTAFLTGLTALAISACTVPGDTPPVGTNVAASIECDFGAPHVNAPSELAQFSFLIGNYDITSHIMTPQGWSPPRPGPHAQWNGRYSLGGMTITDEWYDPNPDIDPDAPRGVNVRMYDVEESVWKMMWISTNGKQVQDLRAEMRDGKLTMWNVYPERIKSLADFTIEDADHWHRISYVKDDADEWVPQFKLRATRIPCG